MRSDPKPNEIAGFFYGQGPIVFSYTNRPVATDSLQVQGRICWCLLQNLKLLVGGLLSSNWEFPVTFPKPRASVMIHKSELFPDSNSSMASRAYVSSFPLLISRSI